ncbi:MAG TPA: hypothetical protein PJ990_15975, partial [Saprospiraceae bacterium]|nr:hypothetical protein [Saprospiraceae bacterium]
MSVIKKNQSFFTLQNLTINFKATNLIVKKILGSIIVVFYGAVLFGQSTTCNCKEYIYLNEPGLGAVLKFEVGAGVPLTELIGANGGTPPTEHWYPGLGTTEMPKPHGLGSDLNGKLYIASDYQNPNEIRRLDCDGGIEPVSASTVINPANAVFNIFSIGNTLYVTKNGGVAAYNSCTGALIGELCYNDEVGNPNPGSYWGLSHNSVTKMIYGTGRFNENRSIFVYSESEMEQAILNSTCIDPFISLGTTTLSNMMPGDKFIPTDISQIIGITSDDLGNIYVVVYEEGVTPTYGRILKYNSMG